MWYSATWLIGTTRECGSPRSSRPPRYDRSRAHQPRCLRQYPTNLRRRSRRSTATLPDSPSSALKRLTTTSSTVPGSGQASAKRSTASAPGSFLAARQRYCRGDDDVRLHARWSTPRPRRCWRSSPASTSSSDRSPSDSANSPPFGADGCAEIRRLHLRAGPRLEFELPLTALLPRFSVEIAAWAATPLRLRCQRPNRLWQRLRSVLSLGRCPPPEPKICSCCCCSGRGSSVLKMVWVRVIFGATTPARCVPILMLRRGPPDDSPESADSCSVSEEWLRPTHPLQRAAASLCCACSGIDSPSDACSGILHRHINVDPHVL